MNSEKSSTTQNQKNQTHEPRKIINNPKLEKSNFTFSQSNPLISQQTLAHKVTKPITTIVDQKRERGRDLGLEREKKSEIDKERSKRTIQTQTTQTSKSQRLHAVPMLLISSASSSSFFLGRSPLLILLGRSSSLFFFSTVVWDIFQPTQFESKSSQIKRDRD